MAETLDEPFSPDASSPIYSSLNDCGDEIEWNLRRDLNLILMNPVEKVIFSKRLSWKLCLQVCKVIFICIQVNNFSTKRMNNNEFYRNDDRILASNLYPGDDYEGKNFYSDFCHYQTYDEFNSFLSEYYQKFMIFEESTLRFTSPNRSIMNYEMISHHLFLPDPFMATSMQYGIISSMDEMNVFLEKIRLKKLLFRLDEASFSVHFRKIPIREKPSHHDLNCFDVEFTIKMKVSDDGACVTGYWSTQYNFDKCRENRNDRTEKISPSEYLTIVLIVLFCFLSVLFCIWSLYRRFILARRTYQYFKNLQYTHFSMLELTPMIDVWVILIVLSDVFAIISIAGLFQIDMPRTRECLFVSTTHGICSLLILISILRYVSYFEPYKKYLTSLSVSISSISAFGIIWFCSFMAFAFSGYIVLGPKMEKFRSFATTCASLYGLMVGDEIFIAFSSIPNDSLMLACYAKIYLTLFHFIFLYAVASNFVAILNLYGLENHGKQSMPKTTLMLFLEKCRCSRCSWHV